MMGSKRGEMIAQWLEERKTSGYQTLLEREQEVLQDDNECPANWTEKVKGMESMQRAAWAGCSRRIVATL